MTARSSLPIPTILAFLFRPRRNKRYASHAAQAGFATRRTTAINEVNVNQVAIASVDDRSACLRHLKSGGAGGRRRNAQTAARNRHGERSSTLAIATWLTLTSLIAVV